MNMETDERRLVPVKRLIRALIRAEDLVHGDETLTSSPGAGDELDRSFEHLTGVVPATMEGLPPPQAASLLRQQSQENQLLVREFLRLKTALLEKTGDQRRAGVYQHLGSLWDRSA